VPAETEGAGVLIGAAGGELGRLLAVIVPVSEEQECRSRVIVHVFEKGCPEIVATLVFR
jgi:hypothetical protein